MPAWEILQDLLIILASALVLGTIAERLQQSAILGYLLAGTLIGPHVLGFVREAEHIPVIAELGVALLLFTIGLEFSFRRLLQLGRGPLLGGVLQISVTIGLVMLLLLPFGHGWIAAFSIGSMVALSSTACVLRVLQDRAALDSLYGRYSLGVLLVQDVAVIPLLLLVVVLNAGEGLGSTLTLMARTAIGGLVLVVLLYVILNHLAPRLLQLEQWARNRELPVIMAVLLALGSAYAAHAAGLSPAMGAFVAGALLGASPFANQVRSDIAGLRTLLVTLFFASIGMLANPQWAVENATLVAGVVALILLVKSLVIWGLLRGLGLSNGPAWATGLCLAQVGEFSFVLSEAVKETGNAANGDIFAAIAPATIVTLFMTPLLIAYASRKAVAAETSPARPAPPDTAGTERDDPDRPDRPAARVLIVGFGPAGQAVAETLYDRLADSILVMDLNKKNVDVARQYGLATAIGDATHLNVLEHAKLSEVAAVAITIPDPLAVRRVIENCRIICPSATVVARARYHTYRWELLLAGPDEVVDEERLVGLQIAAALQRGA